MDTGREAKTVLSLVQLSDGTFKLVIDYEDESVKIHQTWYFTESEQSEAEVAREILVTKLR